MQNALLVSVDPGNGSVDVEYEQPAYGAPS